MLRTEMDSVLELMLQLCSDLVGIPPSKSASPSPAGGSRRAGTKRPLPGSDDGATAAQAASPHGAAAGGSTAAAASRCAGKSPTVSRGAGGRPPRAGVSPAARRPAASRNLNLDPSVLLNSTVELSQPGARTTIACKGQEHVASHDASVAVRVVSESSGSRVVQEEGLKFRQGQTTAGVGSASTVGSGTSTGVCFVQTVAGRDGEAEEGNVSSDDEETRAFKRRHQLGAGVKRLFTAV